MPSRILGEADRRDIAPVVVSNGGLRSSNRRRRRATPRDPRPRGPVRTTLKKAVRRLRRSRARSPARSARWKTAFTSLMLRAELMLLADRRRTEVLGC